jgi:hypothetical protein
MTVAEVLFLDLLFYSIDLHICFCSATLLVLLVYNLKSGIVIPSALLFFAHECFGYSEFFILLN